MALAVWAGLLVGARLGAGGAGCACALLAPFALLAARGPDRVGTVALLVALALAGAARRGAHEVILGGARARLETPDRLFRIEGRVSAPPQRESGEPIVILCVRSAEPALPAETLVRLRLPAGTEVQWSDRLMALARLDAPSAIRNPGGFDARTAADAAALAAVGRAYAVVTTPATGLDGWPRATFGRWRRAIEQRLAVHLSPETRELVVPLVLGDRSALSTELNARLRASGLIHLLALSGLHVAWMAAIARGAVSAAGRGMGARAWAGGLCALGYVGVAGPLPSLMRAAATEVLSSVARGFSRALDPVQALALSALGLLVVAPGWATDLGFQLSCAATLGLVTLGPAVPGSAGRWRSLHQAVIPTASAQLTAMPLLLDRFHAASWIAPLSNLAAVPISGLLLSAAWLAIVLDGVAPGMGRPWFGACEVLSHALRLVTDWAAAVPSALWSAGPETAPAIAAAVGAALLVIACSGPRDLEGRRLAASRARVAAGALGALASALALGLVASARPLLPPGGSFWVVVLDVGQGDAVALGFGDGWWLVDAGPRSSRYDAGEGVVLPFFRWAGVRRLESLLLTHDDADHVGGAPAVSRGLAAARVIAPPRFPGLPGPGPRFGAMAAARGSRLRTRPDVRVLWPPAPDSETIARAPGGGVRRSGATQWGPREEDVTAGRLNDNASSLVLELGTGVSRVLLLADVDSTVEARLPVAPGVGLIKVAHHGSGSSSGVTFLDRARPRRAAISCGMRNPFGHPHRGALNRLRAAGSTIHRTDEAGALWFECGTAGIRLVEWREGMRKRDIVDRGPIPCAPRAPRNR